MILLLMILVKLNEQSYNPDYIVYDLQNATIIIQTKLFKNGFEQ